MKYIVINGSPRKKNTWKVVKQVMKNLDSEIEEVHLSKEKILMCNGCSKCIIDGENKCPHFDIINPIVEKLKAADGIIISSPVYAMNVSGILKNLLDHTAYFYHRPEFFTKKAMVIVTTAGAGHNNVAKYLDETLRQWGVNKVYKLAFTCGGKDPLDIKKIDKLTLKFKKDTESKKMHSPKIGDIIFYNVWKVMALKEDGIPADVHFWQNTGLIKYDFSPEVNLGIFKKIFSKLMFNFLKRVM